MKEVKQAATVLSTSSYDGASLRVKKVAGSTSTRYIFSGTKVLAEYVNGSLSKEHIYAGSQLLATLSSSGTPTYHHPDHLSVRVNTDSAGTVVGQQGHYPYGESWYSQSTTTKWQFTSYERDSESSLDYATFRYRSSRLGRFQTPDPLAGSILNPQSLNRYSYVRNDPVNFIDPLGLDCYPTPWGGIHCDVWEPLPSVVPGIEVEVEPIYLPDPFGTDANFGTTGTGSPCVEVHVDGHTYNLCNMPFQLDHSPSISGGSGQTVQPKKRARLRPRTDQEYQDCVRKVQQERDKKIRTGRILQATGGVVTLVGVGVTVATLPALVAAWPELVIHGVGAAAFLTPPGIAAAGVGGFGYGSYLIAQAWDEYNEELIKCAGAVSDNPATSPP